MMELQLLADRPEAITTVARLYFNQWGHKLKDNSYEKTCDRIRGMLNRDRAPLYVIAIEANEVLGIAQLKIREMDIYPDKEYWLGSVFVPQKAEGKGIASQLALRVAAIAGSFGAQKIHLYTRKLDGGLYAKLGWLPVEQVHYHDRDALVMEKTLGV